MPGNPWPYTPGYGVVGVVDMLGPGQNELAIGERVAALIMTGGYAEYVVTPARRCVRVPMGLDSVSAVCLVLNYITARQMLHRLARVQPGERILVDSGAGGVGTALLQFGALAGLEVYATASAPKHVLVRRLGATPVNFRSEDFVERIRGLTGDGVDAFFDAVGPSTFLRSYRALRRGGRAVGYGTTDGIGRGRIRLALAVLLVLGLNVLPDGRRTYIYAIDPIRKER